MQQLCENHNTDLQNYMRFQKYSRKNYDLVLKCVSLLYEE